MLVYQFIIEMVPDEADSAELARVRKVIDLLNKEESTNAAPDCNPRAVSPYEFFRKFEGPPYEDRVEDLNISQEMYKTPKAYDVALSFALDDKRRARRLLADLIDTGNLHRPVGECDEYFESFDRRAELYDELAELEARKHKQQVLDRLWKAGNQTLSE
jgi:hypothetical protein